MTTFNPVPLVATGDWITATWLNTYVRQNMTALFPGTTAGDLDYYSSATEKARLGIGAVDTVLTPLSGAPAWSHTPNIKGILHATANVDWYNSQSSASTSFIDVTGGTVNIVTTKTCTLVMHARGIFRIFSNGDYCVVRGMINGVAHSPSSNVLALPRTQNTNFVPFEYTYKLAGVAAGTITCKLQFRSYLGTWSAFIDGGQIDMFAYVE